MASFKLSEQQQNVIDWVKSGSGSMILKARAGCGKTFVLRQVIMTIAKAYPQAETFCGAFNKAIAGEIAEAVKEDFKAEGLPFDWKKIGVSTLHSAGFSAWRYKAKNKDLKVNEKKVAEIFEAMVKALTPRAVQDEMFKATSVVLDLVSYAKQRGFGFLVEIDDTKEWFDMVDHFGVEEVPAGTDAVIEWAKTALKTSISQDWDVIDFDDMLLAPLVHGARFFGKDWVLIDEAQDTNPVRRALALALLKPKTGRLIAVGDEAQAIYGFTGADSDSLDQIQKSLGAVVMPLNTTYRCPKAVVEFAQQFVSDIKAHESAPQGSVEYVDVLPQESLTAADAILCRNTAPLVSLAFGLIRDGIGCKVEGRDIGKGLIALATRWKIKTTSELRARLDAYLSRETTKWLAKDREEMVQAVDDKVQTLFLLIGRLALEQKHLISDVVDTIQSLFGDDVSGAGLLTLATIHRSKGREWPTVYWYAPELCPSPWARKDWQVVQEENLQYVAATRAMDRLVFVPGPPKAKAKAKK